MLLAHFLRPVLDGGAPHIGVLEVLDHHSVDLVAEVFDAGMTPPQHHWLIVVWQLSLFSQYTISSCIVVLIQNLAYRLVSVQNCC